MRHSQQLPQHHPRRQHPVRDCWSAAQPVRQMPAPSYSQEVQNRGGEALYRGDRLPAAPQNVRPEYQESGRWIAQPGA